MCASRVCFISENSSKVDLVDIVREFACVRCGVFFVLWKIRKIREDKEEPFLANGAFELPAKEEKLRKEVNFRLIKFK